MATERERAQSRSESRGQEKSLASRKANFHFLVVQTLPLSV